MKGPQAAFREASAIPDAPVRGYRARNWIRPGPARHLPVQLVQRDGQPGGLAEVTTARPDGSVLQICAPHPPRVRASPCWRGLAGSGSAARRSVRGTLPSGPPCGPSGGRVRTCTACRCALWPAVRAATIATGTAIFAVATIFCFHPCGYTVSRETSQGRGNCQVRWCARRDRLGGCKRLSAAPGETLRALQGRGLRPHPPAPSTSPRPSRISARDAHRRRARSDFATATSGCAAYESPASKTASSIIARAAAESPRSRWTMAIFRQRADDRLHRADRPRLCFGPVPLNSSSASPRTRPARPRDHPATVARYRSSPTQHPRSSSLTTPASHSPARDPVPTSLPNAACISRSPLACRTPPIRFSATTDRFARLHRGRRLRQRQPTRQLERLLIGRERTPSAHHHAFRRTAPGPGFHATPSSRRACARSGLRTNPATQFERLLECEALRLKITPSLSDVCRSH